MGGELRILEPCTRDRDSLDGQGAVRWCPDCQKNVYDFSLLTGQEIQRLTAAGNYLRDHSAAAPGPAPVSSLGVCSCCLPIAVCVSARFSRQCVGVVVDSMGGLIPGARVQILSAAVANRWWHRSTIGAAF
jgi:hypothetical protein